MNRDIVGVLLEQGTRMSRLELRQLQLVRAITRNGNLTRAAEELCISQPAASRQLTELEDSLGLMLFSRTPKAMIPTEAGAEFHRHACELLDSVAALEHSMYQRSHSGGGKLRLAIDRVHREDWLAPVIAKFRAMHANVELAATRVPDLLQSLVQREADLAIMGESPPAPGIGYIELQADEMLAIVPASHRLSTAPYVSARDLRWADLLYCFDFETSYLRRRYLEPQGVELNSFHHIESVDAILRLVEAGEGLTILPRRLVNEALASPRLVARPIGPEGMRFHWYAGIAIDSPKPYLRDFVELLRQEAAAAS
jgi:DNA-binding transcriptional LysR family regulator